jgi:hypothetical protein
MGSLVYPLDIIAGIIIGRFRTGPGMSPTLLEAQNLATLTDMNTLTRVGLAVGTILVILPKESKEH